MSKACAILLTFALATTGHAALFDEGDRTSALPTPTSHDAHHAHELHGDTAPSDGEPWPTDEALRTGISRIETALQQTTTAERLRQSESARELARTVEENVAYIIEHCKLPPAPDSALHVLLVRMIAAANQLKHDASRDAAVAQLASVLRDYHHSFDHSSGTPTPR
jgi:hypothetical protein